MRPTTHDLTIHDIESAGGRTRRIGVCSCGDWARVYSPGEWWDERIEAHHNYHRGWSMAVTDLDHNDIHALAETVIGRLAQNVDEYIDHGDYPGMNEATWRAVRAEIIATGVTMYARRPEWFSEVEW